MTNKLVIEPEAYQAFLKEYHQGTEHKHLRLGQAFYNHFKLDKMSNQEQFGNLYEETGQVALDHIRQLFDLM